MASGKQNFIEVELDWAENQLKSWREYIEQHPIHMLEDRIEWKVTKGNKVPHVIATREAQGRFLQDLMKNFLALLGEVNKLRNTEEAIKKARGDKEIPVRMRRKKE